jgi:hypothetical protein
MTAARREASLTRTSGRTGSRRAHQRTHEPDREALPCR